MTTLSCAINWLETAESSRLAKTSHKIADVGDVLTCVVSHPYNDLLLLGTSNGKVVIVEPSQGQIVHGFQAHVKDVTRILLSKDAQRFLSASVDGFLQWWSQDLSRLQGYHAKAAIYTACLSDDGRELVAAGEDGKIRIWAVDTGTLLDTIDGHPDPVCASQWVGKQLVTAGAEGHLLAWDINSRRIVRRQKPHEARISQLVVSHSKSFYITASWDQTIRVWNANHKERFAFPPGSEAITAVALTEDDRTLYAAYWDGVVRVWDMEKGTQCDELHSEEPSLIGCVLLSRSRKLVTANQDGTLRGWNLAEVGVTQYKNQHAGEVYSVRFTPDNIHVASSGYDGHFKIWDRNQRRESETIETGGAPLTCCEVSPAGRYWIAGTADGRVRIWNAADRSEEANFKAHDDAVTAIRFLPLGSHFVTSSWDLKLKLWSIETRRPLEILDGANKEVSDCAISLDGRRLAAVSWDGNARLWDLSQRGRLLRESVHILKGHEERLLCCDFSPDGEVLATGSSDRTIRLWMTAGVGKPRILMGHTADVTALRFTSDGHLLISSDRNGNLLVWDLEDGVMLQNISHRNPILSVDCAPDCGQVVIGDEVGNLRFLQLDYAPGLSWIAAATYLRRPPIWKRGAPHQEHHDVACPECGHIETIRRRDLGRPYKCNACGAQWMLCAYAMPPVMDDE